MNLEKDNAAFQKQFLGFLVINDKLLCAGALDILRCNNKPNGNKKLLYVSLKMVSSQEEDSHIPTSISKGSKQP